jgi:hypothetical protein
MKLAFTQSFPAAPSEVVDLMGNEAFIADVAQHAGALSHAARVLGDRTELDLEMPTPANVAGIIGNSVKMTLTMQFSAPRTDGSVPGTVDVRVPGMPVEASAVGLLAPAGDSTTGSYEGELKVKIPLVGRKVEAQVEPFVVAAFEGIERRARVWLTR